MEASTASQFLSKFKDQPEAERCDSTIGHKREAWNSSTYHIDDMTYISIIFYLN
jgi:hypothetical protein